MATVDSLEAIIESKVVDANNGIEKLLGNLDLVIGKISAIQNNKGLRELSNTAKSVSETMGKAGAKVAQSLKPVEEQTKQLQKNVSEVAKDFQEKFKDIPVKVDFSKPESELKKFQNQAKNAENALARIMASSNAEKQIGSIEKWSISLAQANNAVEQLQDNLSKTAKLDIEQPKINSSDYEWEHIEHLKNAGASRLAQEYLEDIQNSVQQATESIREYNSAFDSSAMSDVFGEAAKSVENWSQVVEQLGDNAVVTLHELSQPFEVQIDGVEEAEQQIRNFSEQIQNMKDLFLQSFSALKNGEIFHYLSESVQNFAKNAQAAAGIKIYTEDYRNILEDVERTESALEKLQQQQRDLQAAGIDAKSNEWQKVATEIDTAEKRLESYIDKMQEMRVMGTDVEFSGGLANQSWIKTMGAVAGEAMSSLRQRISEIGSAVSQAIGNIPIIGRAAKEAAFIGQAAFNGLKSVISGISSVAGKTVNVISNIASAFKKLASGIKNVISKFFSFTKASNGMNTSFLGGLKTMLKYSLGIRSLYTLFNKLRSAIKDGFENLILYDDKTNQSLSMLKSSLNQLKNSLAAAFAPVLNAIAPALNFLIQLLIKATNAVNQFLSALLGGTSWIRAKFVYDDVADSISGAAKAAKGALQPFDALNNLTTQDTSGGGSALPEDMFETLPIEDKFKDLVDWLKDMWKNADFYDLGKLLGDKLAKALANIPWDKIKSVARKLGKSLATLINGFIEGEFDGISVGWWIGHTLAEGINTAFEFLNSFVHNINWSGIGKFIADSINGFTQSIDWELIYDTLTTAAKGLSDLINNSTDTLDWVTIATSVSNFFNTLIDTIYVFITETDWIALAEKVGKTISDAFTGIDWKKAGRTVGEAFKVFFDFIATTIENVDWWAVGESVRDFLVGIDWAGVFDSFCEAIGAIWGGFAAFIGGLISDGVEEAKQYFQDKIEEAGGNFVDGIKLGIRDGLADIAEWLLKHVYEPFMEGFCKAFGIHSPSTEMAEMGKYIIEGLLKGLKDTWSSITEWIEDKVGWIIDKFKGIGEKIKGAFSGGVTSGSLGSVIGRVSSTKQISNYNISSIFENYSTAYPTFESYNINPAMMNPSEYTFPAYANGQVITPSMEKHLAWLGDNKSETEVVSPLSTIEKALENVINRLGGVQSSDRENSGDNGDIVINIDGAEIFRVTRKQAQDFKNRTGKLAFT